MNAVTIEAIGYVASLFIVLSLAMRSVVRLRIASLIGGVTYTVYGALIGSWPIIITNVVVVGLNAWNLRHEFATEDRLGAVPIAPNAPFLADFLRSHLDDIHESQPAYDDPSRGDTAFVLMREGLPAGVVVGTRDGSRYDVLLDYVLPAYRDSRLGRWFYGERTSPLPAVGITEVTAVPDTEIHRSYLRQVGFVPVGTLMRRSLE